MPLNSQSLLILILNILTGWSRVKLKFVPTYYYYSQLFSVRLSVTQCTVDKWYILQQKKCLKKWIGSAPHSRMWFGNFQPSTPNLYSQYSQLGLEWSSSVSENCNVLDHIPAATEDRLLSTMFLLNLLILEHHCLILILVTLVKCPCNVFYRLSVT